MFATSGAGVMLALSLATLVIWDVRSLHAQTGIFPFPSAAGEQERVLSPEEQRKLEDAQFDPLRAPSPAALMAMWEVTEPAIRAWEPLPEAPPPTLDEAMLREMRSVCGVHIQLRLDGKVIGRGTSVSLERSADGAGGYAHVRRALDRAMAQARKEMTIPNDALAQENARLIAAEMSISLEAAAALVPFEPNTAGEIATRTNPGVSGLGVQIADAGTLHTRFPSEMLAANMLPHTAFGSLVSAAIGEGGAAAALESPKALRENRGVRMYRFNAAHMAQSEPGGAPTFLVRGSRPIHGAMVTLDDLRGHADAMAENLLVRLRGGAINAADEKAGERIVLGVIEPWLAAQDVDEASPAEQAFAAFALREFAATPGLPEARADELRREARRAIELLDPEGLTGEVDASMVMLALASTGAGPEPLRLKAQNILKNAFDANKGFTETLAPYVHGAVAAALVAQAEISGAPADLEVARAAVRKVFAETPPDRLAMHTPWLPMAEPRLAALENKLAERNGGEIPSAVALRELRARLWKHQFTQLDASMENSDLLGGFVFTAAGATPLPSWQSARPLVFIAQSIRDPRLTDEREQASELGRSLQAVRFLRQLQINDAATWCIPNPRVALGAVKTAPWDLTLPPDATSMSLLALTEVLKSADALDADGRKRLAAQKAQENPAKTGENQGPKNEP